MNMAALYQVPVLFICENNGYGISTSISRSSAVKQLYKKSAAYETPGIKVDGMDVLAVYDGVRLAAEKARKGGGPHYIEAITYRFRGHSISDPGTYRSNQEKKLWQERDPILNFRGKLLEESLAAEAELDSIDYEEKELLEETIKFAEESPFPEPDELWTDIYSDQ
jgi:pyruvate dehydrogenase E1 component alpha subunit